MDLDYIRALYPPEGEHLGDDPTVCSWGPSSLCLSRVRKDEGSSVALVKVSSGERLGRRGGRPACCHFALLQLQESSQPTRKLTDGREISRWWCGWLLWSSVAKAGQHKEAVQLRHW
jgi:hypothetical protein